MNLRKIIWLISGCFLFIFSCTNDQLSSSAVIVNPVVITEITDSLYEISGIIFKDENNIYAHNDSGQDPLLFSVSILEKKVNRKIKITNTENIDWEDITQDQQYIYIADTGNNLGNRTNLRILKLSKDSILNSDSIAAEIIQYSYPDQFDFAASNSHNFDCESIFSFENELFLFSKNRLDTYSKWYVLPKLVGQYISEKKGEIDVEGALTGAAINEEGSVVALIGYVSHQSQFDPFIWLIYDFDQGDILSGKRKKLIIPFPAQIEAIDFKTEHLLYFAPESEDQSEPIFLYSIDISEIIKE